MLAFSFWLFTGIWFAVDVQAAIKTKAIIYKDGKITLNGTMAWDDSITGKRPGILILHEWWGLADYATGRAKQLAAAGYVTCALDMYGVDKITKHADQAGKWAKQVNSNIEGWVRRAQSGLSVLKADGNVDGFRTAAIRYCFKGPTVMQMAYAGLGR